MTTKIALATAVATCAAAPALATENGQTEYPIGVSTVLSGIMPPPGSTEFLNYSVVYDAGALVGPSGKKIAPNFHVTVEADALRILHTWKGSVGPFHITSGFAQPILHNDLHVAGESGQATGPLDLALQPIYLNYTNPSHTLFAFVGLDVFVPTGRYHRDRLVNLGDNYVTFAPNAGVTWFATPRTQLSTWIESEAHTANHATGYHSGSTIDFDYSADYQPLAREKRFHVGVQGYFLQQLTDDSVGGKTYLDGNRGRVFAVGPQFRWDWDHGGIALKWDHETLVENRTRGDRVWVQFALPIAR